MKQKLLWSLLLGLFLSMSAFAQQRTITGTVTDSETGETLPGVNVIIKGTINGSVTDINGKYSVEASQGDVLVFQGVGLAKQEITVGGQSTIDISMAIDTRQLGEVVVTAIGIESEKRTLGYSVQSVKSEDIVSSRETNLVNALNSKVAGVQVVSSAGSPGASANIRIRGNTSITGNNSPLFVVDGVPISNGSSGNGTDGVDNSNRAIDINPNDIASLTVLKGPAATVLYGIRASSGAVIITTKRGQSGKPRISVSSSYTADEVNRLPALQSTYAQGRPSGGVRTYRGPETGEGNSWGPLISSLEFDGATDYPYDRNGRLVPAGTGNGVAARAYDPATFFKTGNTWDNSISVNGGTDAARYFVSFGYLTQTGIVPNADFERITARANVDFKVSEKISAGISAGYTNSGGNRIQRGSNISGVMLGLLRNTPTFDIGNGLEGQEAADNPATYQLPDGTQRSYRAGIYDNPYWTANKNPFQDDVNRIIGNMNLGYQALPWLKFTYKVGIDFYVDRRTSGFDINSASVRDGSVSTFSQNVTFLNSDALAIVSKKLNDDFQLDALIGHNYFEQSFNTQTGSGFTLGIPGLFNFSNASTLQTSETVTSRKVHGVFADFKLSWRDMLFFNLSARNDWSSTLPADNNSILYPAVSLGFAFSELIPENDLFTYGKLRLSYGEVGNDAPVFATSNYFNSLEVGGDGFITPLTSPINGIGAFELATQAGNNQIVPELTKTFEIGGEFRFLKDRLTLDLTYYNSRSEGQIIGVALSAATGFTTAVQNAGTIENSGWEVMLQGIAIQAQEAGGFQWDIDVNFTKYKNIVTELAEGVSRIGLSGFTSTSSNVIAGQPYGVIFGSRYQRNDAGQVIVGADGWPLQASTDGPVGDPNPDFLLGIRNSFSWKGITVSALLDIRQGGDVWCGTCGILDYFGTSQRSADTRDITGYVFPGVQQDGSANTVGVDFANPAAGFGGARYTRYGFGGLSEDSMFDGSWIRMRELTVSYALPSSLFDNNFVRGINLSFTARNLFVITDYPGIDPETNLTGADNGIGLDYFNMPNTRSYGFSLRVDL
jgi:TonB-linked SusC/RagA family outer membrane protein